MVKFLTNPVVYKCMQYLTVIALCGIGTLIFSVNKKGGFEEDGKPSEGGRVKYYSVTKNKNNYKQYKERNEYKKPKTTGKGGF